MLYLVPCFWAACSPDFIQRNRNDNQWALLPLLVFCKEPKPHVQTVSEIQICIGSNCFQRWAQLLFCQVHCISTEFTPRKHGGEKGVPFRVQIDTFKQNENGEYTEHLHSASCQIKVFKVWGSFGFVSNYIKAQDHAKISDCVGAMQILE